ncbi:hypothetical protein SCHPADRAFT_939839 [Schizopora paradoxa]|uniref:HECT domain-containing protein n=1 Tax=Schizopora paradoxa TaxID=27342 RepID=A0A0H2RR34_9AGAM|nr:hypothetical protein SCHPADRAFT_939839 [Schizopora paradoxa]
MSNGAALPPREVCRKCLIAGTKHCKLFICYGSDGQMTDIPIGPLQECSFCSHPYVFHILSGPKDGVAGGILDRYGADSSECGGFIKKTEADQLQFNTQCACGLELGAHDKNPVDSTKPVLSHPQNVSQITPVLPSPITANGQANTLTGNIFSPAVLEQLLAAYRQHDPGQAAPASTGPPIEAFRNPFSPGGHGQGTESVGNVNDRRMESSARQNARQNAQSVRASSVSSTKAQTPGTKRGRQAKTKASTTKVDSVGSSVSHRPLKFLICVYPICLLRKEPIADLDLPSRWVSRDSLSTIQHTLHDHKLTCTIQPSIEGPEPLWRSFDEAISSIVVNADLNLHRPLSAGAVRDTSNTGWVLVALQGQSGKSAKGKEPEGRQQLLPKVLTPSEFTIEKLQAKPFGAAMPNWLDDSTIIFVCPRYRHIAGPISNFRGLASATLMPDLHHLCYPLRIADEMQLADEDGKGLVVACVDSCVTMPDLSNVAHQALSVDRSAITPKVVDHKPGLDSTPAATIPSLPVLKGPDRANDGSTSIPLFLRSPSPEDQFPASLIGSASLVNKRADGREVSASNIDTTKDTAPSYCLDSDGELVDDEEMLRLAIAESLAFMQNKPEDGTLKTGTPSSTSNTGGPLANVRQRARSVSINAEANSPPRTRRRITRDGVEPKQTVPESNTMDLIMTQTLQERVSQPRLKKPVGFKHAVHPREIAGWARRLSTLVPDRKTPSGLDVSFRLQADSMSNGVDALKLFIAAKLGNKSQIEFESDLIEVSPTIVVSWVGLNYLFKETSFFIIGEGCGVGVRTSLIREAVKSYVADKQGRWCEQVGEYYTLCFHGGDQLPAERIMEFKVFGCICALHMVLLRCGPDPMSPFLFYLVVDGRIAFSLDMKFIAVLDADSVRILKPLQDWDGKGASVQDGRSDLYDLLTAADISVKTISAVVPENERHGINVSVMSRMFLGASNLERMEEFLAFRTGFNVQLNENTLLLDTFKEGESVKGMMATFYGRRIETPEQVIKLLQFPESTKMELDIDEDPIDLDALGLCPEASGLPAAYYEFLVKEHTGIYLRGSGHPDHTFVRNSISKEEIEAGVADPLLRSRLFLKVLTGSELLPPAGHEIQFDFIHLSAEDEICPNRSDGYRPSFHFHVCSSSAEVTICKGFRKILEQEQRAPREGENALEFEGLIHATLLSLTDGTFNSV